MKSRQLASLLALAALALALPARAQLTVKDDLGRALILKHPATRIVTLAPFLTEIVYAAGAGDLVVGVDEHSDYPSEVLGVPKIASGPAFTIDRIAKLKPDLVLAWRDGIKRQDVERITAFGTSVYVASARQLEDVPRLLEAVAQLTGRDATPALSAFEQGISRLRRDNASKVRLSAFVEIWNRPLTTVSGEHFLTEALAICKAENIFADRTGVAPKVSIEDVLAKDPQVIISAGSASSPAEFRANWQVRQSLSAVRAQRMLYMPDDTIARPSPRTIQGITKLCAELDNVREGRVQRAMVEAATAPVVRPPAGPLARPLGFTPVLPSAANPTGTYPLGPVPGAAPGPSAGTHPPATPPATGPVAEVPPQAPPADTAPKRPSQYGM